MEPLLYTSINAIYILFMYNIPLWEYTFNTVHSNLSENWSPRVIHTGTISGSIRISYNGNA